MQFWELLLISKNEVPLAFRLHSCAPNARCSENCSTTLFKWMRPSCNSLHSRVACAEKICAGAAVDPSFWRLSDSNAGHTPGGIAPDPLPETIPCQFPWELLTHRIRMDQLIGTDRIIIVQKKCMICISMLRKRCRYRAFVLDIILLYGQGSRSGSYGIS